MTREILEQHCDEGRVEVVVPRASHEETTFAVVGCAMTKEVYSSTSLFRAL
jgi:hypothetical protein